MHGRRRGSEGGMEGWGGAIATMCVLSLSLSAKHYVEAIEWYGYAIEKDPTVAVYYGNRSFAHLKMESYGFALSDASSALDLDRTYIKVLYSIIILWMSESGVCVCVCVCVCVSPAGILSQSKC